MHLREVAELADALDFGSECVDFFGNIPPVKRPGGGIGRRSRFRSCRRKVWGFESLPGHHATQLSEWATNRAALPLSVFMDFKGI